MSTKEKRGIISMAIRTVLAIALLLFLLFFIIQMPSVQNALVGTIVNRLVDESKGQLDIENSKIDLFEGLSLGDITLTDKDGNALAKIDRIKISPRNTLWSLTSGDIALRDVRIDGVHIYYRKYFGQTDSNIDRFLPILSTDSTSTEDGKTTFDLSQLEVNDVYVDYLDEPAGIVLYAQFEALDLKLNSLPQDGKTFDVDHLILTHPDVQYYDCKYYSEDRDSKTSNVNSTKNDMSDLPAFDVGLLQLVNGKIKIVHGGTEPNEDIYTDLDVQLSDIHFEDIDSWYGKVGDLTLKSDMASLDHLSIQTLSRYSGSLILDNVVLRAENSLLRFDARGSDIRELKNLKEANITATFDNSFLQLGDLAIVVPALQKIKKERLATKNIQLNGTYQYVNGGLEAQEIDLWLNGKHHFNGDASIADLSDIAKSEMDLNVTSLTSDIVDLNDLLTSVNIPNEVVRLGQIDFSGSFEGKINDFSSNGKMQTDLGDLFVDIDVSESNETAGEINYEGFLRLDTFDISGLLDNDDFGSATAAIIISNGKGTDIPNSNANIFATIEEIQFKEYTYNNATYAGYLSKRVVDGKFSIGDESLSFNFDGLIDLSQEVPLFQFGIDAQAIDFCKLNLSTFPCNLSFTSDFNIVGKNTGSAIGGGQLNDIVLMHDSLELNIKSLELSSDTDGDGMIFKIESDYVDATVSGEFNLLKLYQVMLRQLIENHSEHADVLKLTEDFGELPDQNFLYDITLKDADPLFSFLGIDLGLAGSTRIKGRYDHTIGQLVMDIKSPKLQFDNIEASEMSIHITSGNGVGVIDARFDELKRDNIAIPQLTFNTQINGDSLEWKASYSNSEYDRIFVHAKSGAAEGGYFTNFVDNDIMIDSVQWAILPSKGIGLFKESIDIEGFVVTDGERSISLKDIDKRGVELNLNRFDFQLINPLINYDKLYFTGYADSKVSIRDVFNERVISGYLEVPELDINGDPYGKLFVEAIQQENDIIDLQLNITKDNQNLFSRGYADLKNEFVSVELNLQEYPLAFLEYIVDDGISETVGLVNIDAKIEGKFDDLKLDGSGIIQEGGTKIDYLGAFYRIDNQRVDISETLWDFTDVIMIDELGNEAIITGGLRHDFLADFRADLVINSDRFIGLNTTKEDNPLYYGLGIGDLDVEFKGPFDAIDIRVNAVTGKLSQLAIPITSTQYGYEESFVVFNDSEEVSDSIVELTLEERLKESGVDFEMNLSFTPEAEVLVIYDEETSNVLIGHGRGDLSVKVKRNGDFTVYGNYDVIDGQYLYTAYGFIAKPFNIRSGGTVTWTGDPINANLDLVADYPNLRAPLNVFLQEYVEASSLPENEFSQRQDVDLNLLLTGTLFNPAINFDISFPDLTGELRTLANSKVQTLRTTENGINNQVVGLLFFRDFLPDNNPIASLGQSTLGQTGNNTITEFLTSQLSLLASDYLSDKLSGDVITGIDLDIALAQNTSLLSDAGQGLISGLVDFVPDEVQLNSRYRFKNDNFILNLGGNFVRENNIGSAQNYLTGDFALDWYITENKRLKLRFYGNYDYDEAFAERKQKYGFGINFRREFGKIAPNSLQDGLDQVAEQVNQFTNKEGVDK